MNLDNMEYYQTVILTLEDGRRCVFTGPAITEVGETPLLKIVKVQLTMPAKLPDGCKLEVMETCKDADL